MEQAVYFGKGPLTPKSGKPIYDAQAMAGLPVGIQVVLPPWEEERCLGAMKVVEHALKVWKGRELSRSSNFTDLTTTTTTTGRGVCSSKEGGGELESHLGHMKEEFGPGCARRKAEITSRQRSAMESTWKQL